MEIEEITQALEEIRPEDEDPSDSLSIIMTKVGQMAMGGLQLDADGAEEQLGEETIDEQRRDLVAGLVFAAVEYCAEHDIEMETALQERMEQMQEAAEQRQKIKEAMESGDAQELADALGADANEVPTGDDEDEDGPRGFM
jgi:hypothetical protein